MAYFSGRDGALFVGDTQIARVQSWSLSASVDALETTDLGDGARDYTPGVKSATGSATIFYYDSGPESLINKVLQTGNIEDSDKVALSLRWGSTRRINATVLVTSADVGLQTGEVMTASINFTVCGDYTSVTL